MEQHMYPGVSKDLELALKKGAAQQEIMEAIWVAAEMRAGGGAFAHSNLAIDTMIQARGDTSA